MPEDRVTITADASQYFDVLSRAGVAGDRLAGSGDRIGAGFLRGDRVVRTATANIVRGLAFANNAADAVLLTMQSLERVFMIPIGLTIFAAGAIAAAEAISRIIDKEQTLREDIHKLKSDSSLGGDFLNSSQINQNLKGTSDKIKEVSKDLIELKSGKGKFLGIDFMGSETRAFFEDQDRKKLADLHDASANDVLDLTRKQNDLNKISQETLDDNEEAAEIDKARVEHNEKLGELGEIIKNAQLQETDAAKQLLSTEEDRYQIVLATLDAKRQERKFALEEAAVGILGGIKSGAILKDVQNDKTLTSGQKDAATKILTQFQQVAPGMEKAIQNQVLSDFEKNHPSNFKKLGELNFDNLSDLARIDFSGLKPLDGLTIQIQ